MQAIRTCLNKKKSQSQISSSLKRQWINWMIVLAVNILVTSSYWVTIPSMHQFITNPTRELIHNQENLTIQNDTDYTASDIIPGLGASEYIYSWIVTAYAFGELIGAPIAGLLITLLPYHITIPIGCVVNIIAGVLYATSVNSVMIFTARFLLGFFGAFAQVLMGSYFGESADLFEVAYSKKKEGIKQTAANSHHNFNSSAKVVSNKKGKMTQKDTLFILWGFSTTLLAPLALGIGSIMALFPRVNQLRWPGWFIAVTSAVYIIAFVIVFEMPCTQCTGKVTSSNTEEKQFKTDHIKKRNGTSKQNWNACVLPGRIKQIMAYSFLILTGYISGSFYVVTDTLVNPILQDQFGFTIADISIFILIALSIPIMSMILVTIVKVMSMYLLRSIDNRQVFAGLLCIAIAGGLIMSDWQAIGNDPCSSTFCNEFKGSNNSSFIFDACTRNFEDLSFNLFLNSSTSEIEGLCTNASTSKHTCYWNPRSRITGKYCSDCTQRCNSTQKSLYFAQLCVGLILAMFVLQVTQVFVSIIASDYTPTEYQGILMGAMFTASGLSRIVSPPWNVRVYEASNKHTYIVMTMNSLIVALVLVLLLVVYKRIGPKTAEAKSEQYKLVNTNQDSSKELLMNHFSDSDDDDSHTW